MTRIRTIGIFLVLLTGIFSPAAAQNDMARSKYDGYRVEVEQMVSYLQYCLNLLGDDSVDVADKDAIINSSYTKIFRDAKVQVEDDLDEKRRLVSNKNVQAYLKDIDFFFRRAVFKFTVQDISYFLSSGNQVVFRVTMQRSLNGTDLDNKPVSNTKPRYLEINLDEQRQELKIASFYTTKIDEGQDLVNWWDELSRDWKVFFAKDIEVGNGIKLSDVLEKNPAVSIRDSVRWNDRFIRLSGPSTISGLKKLVSATTLDLSGMTFFQDLGPLVKFQELRSLDVSNSLVSDLSALRNCMKLEKLNISRTPVKSIDQLNYLAFLNELDASRSMLETLRGIESFAGLEKLDISNTHVRNLESLKSLPLLKNLRIANLRIYAFEELAALGELELLDISRTDITSLEPLAKLKKLQNLYVENTVIGSLTPLMNLPSLRYVFCDGTGIRAPEATVFMQNKPDCIVIFESDVLQLWWNQLPLEMRNVLGKYVPVSAVPTKEELHQLTRITELDLSHLPVSDLSGLRYLSGLKKIKGSNTAISTLAPLFGLKELEYIDFSETEISDINVLGTLPELRTVILNYTKINSLVILSQLEKIERLEIESTEVKREEAFDFETRHPDAVVLYRTAELDKWWAELPIAWRSIFMASFDAPEKPSGEKLHAIASARELIVSERQDILSVAEIVKLSRLRKLTITGTSLSDIGSLRLMPQLEYLNISRNPVTDFSVLQEMLYLRHLNLSSMRVLDLGFLKPHYNLEYLDVSNTQVKKIDVLSTLNNLQYLDISNTQVRSLSKLKKNTALNTLKCFNSKIGTKAVEQFKKTHPGCDVIHY